MSPSVAAPTRLSASGSNRADLAFRWLLRAAGAIVLVVLALMLAFTAVRSWPVFSKEGFGFLTGRVWGFSPTGTHYGALPFIWGTALTSVIALVIGVPFALAVAAAITDVLPVRLRRTVASVVDLLAAVPSVIFGLWGLLFFVPYVLKPFVIDPLSRTVGKAVPFLAPPAYGFSYFSAGVVLAIMIVPIIAAITREVFIATPPGEREAAYALGATRWEVIRKVVLPRGIGGIVGATMLGLGRALGETIAVALLIGGSIAVDTHVFHPGYSIAALIANTFTEATPEGINALIALGLTLFVITLFVNVAARLVIRRMGAATPREAA